MYASGVVRTLNLFPFPSSVRSGHSLILASLLPLLWIGITPFLLPFLAFVALRWSRTTIITAVQYNQYAKMEGKGPFFDGRIFFPGDLGQSLAKKGFFVFLFILYPPAGFEICISNHFKGEYKKYFFFLRWRANPVPPPHGNDNFSAPLPGRRKESENIGKTSFFVFSRAQSLSTRCKRVEFSRFLKFPFRSTISHTSHFFPYLNAHAEWEWQGGHDEEDGDEGEEERAAAGALGVSWER